MSDHITVLCGASVADIPFPHTIIFPKAFPACAYTFDGPDDAMYAKNDAE